MMKVILNVSCVLILISTFLFNTTDFFTNYIIMASQDKPFKRCNIYCRTKLNRKQTVVVDVRYSPSKPPTFLVMDQPCFPAYINDLPQYMIYNKFRLIADVSIIYRPIMIRSQSDCDKLQVDLQAVTTWEKDWIINYSIEKSFPLQLIY
jgi:hypothetical protein